MGINWGRLATEHTLNVQGIYEAANALRHLGDSGVGISENMRQAAITSTKTLADCAEFIALSGDRTISRSTSQVTGSLRDASAKMLQATELACRSANKATRQFGNDNYRICHTLVEGMNQLGEQLERSSLVVSNDARASVKHLSVALSDFGANIACVGDAHRDASLHLQRAITDGCRSLHISVVQGSDNIRMGLQGAGLQATSVLATAAIFVVIYMYPPYTMATTLFALITTCGPWAFFGLVLFLSYFLASKMHKMFDKFAAQQTEIKESRMMIEALSAQIASLQVSTQELRARLKIVEDCKTTIAQVSDIVDREVTLLQPRLANIQEVY